MMTRRIPTMGGLTYLLILSFVLLDLNPLLAYFLKGCNIQYSHDPLADVVLDCRERQLKSVPDDIPRDVSSVSFAYNSIEQINTQDFGILSKLKYLDLSSNQIAHVDDGSFIHLTSLTTLSIESNKLRKLTGNLFQGLSNLTMLNLGANEIQFIHPSAFSFMPNLHTVILDSNKLQQVTDIQSILQLPHLQKLNISSNHFTSFQSKDLLLNVTSSIKELNISFNRKMEKFSVTTPIFPYLEMIDIRYAGLETGLKWDITDKSLMRNITRLISGTPAMPLEDFRKILESLDSLKHLKLNYAEKWLKNGLLATVCKIPTLRRLELQYNYVDNIGDKLVTCSQLSDLDLSCMNMAELSNGSIQSMQQLRSLNLEVNSLTKVPNDIRSLSSLRVLYLQDNHITALDCEDFMNTTHLTYLDLSMNHLSTLDECTFENLNDLKVLHLSENLLWTFGKAFCTGLQMLEVLDVSKNSISVFERGFFQGLESVKYLYVVSTNIKRVKSRTFEGMRNLRSLALSLPLEYEDKFNEVHQLENLTIYFSTEGSFKSPPLSDHKLFYNLNNLKVFIVICKGYHSGFPLDVPMDMLQAMKHLETFIAENIYTAMPDPYTFQYNHRLKNLTIRQTDLSDLNPEMFLPITNLQVLELSNVNLQSLDFLAQANLTALRHLCLTNNKLTVINETIFQFLPSLAYLDLGSNPFTCYCSNVGFIQWVKSNKQTQVVNAPEYICSFPADEQGRKLMDFDIQSCWIDFSFLYFITSTCLVLLTLLSSFIYHFLRWQIVYAFYLFQAFLYDTRKKRKGAPHHYDAFISYNVHDEDWVYREMLPVLEGEQGWRLCLHHRDFQPGKPIIENITDAIYNSRKTICVISQRYLQSEWCSREIQLASFRLFDEQKDVLILLFLEEIPARQLSPYYRMRKLVKKRTYISWPQAGQHKGVFWQNVQQALETGDAATETTDPLTGPAVC